jgi:succinoglycan biosynthesis transport protein ExoP
MNEAIRSRSIAAPSDARRSDRLDGEQLIQTLTRSWLLIVVVVVLVVGTTAIYLSRQTPVYRAVAAMALMNSELRISQVDTQLESYELTRARVETEMDRLRSRSFAERVADKLDLFKDTTYLPIGEGDPVVGTPERRRAVVDALLSSYQPQRSGESLVIYIEAHANSASMAARIANGVVETFIGQSIEAQNKTLQESAKRLRKQIDDVGEQLTGSQMEVAALIRENVLDDEELPARLRRERSHLAALLEVIDTSAGAAPERVRLEAELAKIEAQLTDRTRNEMQLSRLERNVDLLAQLYQTMVERLNQIEPQLNQVQPDAGHVTVAETPFEPSWPNMPTTLALAVPGGLMLGFVLALVRSAMDRQIWTSAQASHVSQVPNLGNLPSLRTRGLLRQKPQPDRFLRRFPRSEFSEALRSLMTICAGLGGGAHRVTLITSPLPGGGASTVAISMGAMAALEGMRVLLLDFNTRRAGGRNHVSLCNPSASLADLVEGRRTLADTVVPVPDYEGFYVIGFDRQTHLTPRMITAFRDGPLAEMKAAYDMVIIDTSPALSVSDAARLGMAADTALVVVRSGKTSERALQHCILRLQDSGVNLAGTVITDIEPRRFRRMNLGGVDAYF